MILTNLRSCYFIASYYLLGNIYSLCIYNYIFGVLCVLEFIFDVLVLLKSDFRKRIEWYLIIEMCKVLIIDNMYYILFILLVIKVVFIKINMLYFYLFACLITDNVYEVVSTMIILGHINNTYIGEMQLMKAAIRCFI